MPAGIQSFIPKGWIVLQKATGDLNKDNQQDLALVIQDTDKKNILINHELGVDTLDANPRSLMVFFKDSLAGGYHLVTKNDSFILKHDDPVMDDPFAGLEIIKGSLKLSFRLWYSAGSWYTTGASYLFRYQNKDFTLIGAETNTFHRATGESTACSVNFLTKKYSITTGNEFDEKIKPQTTWKTFRLQNMKTITTFVKPFSWDLEGIQL